MNDGSFRVSQQNQLQEARIGVSDELEYKIEFPANTDALIKYTEEVISKIHNARNEQVGIPYKTIIIKKGAKKAKVHKYYENEFKKKGE
jgi:hypothetical protein